MNIEIIIAVKFFRTASWTCSRVNALSDDNFYVTFAMLFYYYYYHHHHLHHRRRRRCRRCHHYRHPYRDYRSSLRKGMFFVIVAS
jgi:hypothetical protein